MNRAEMGKIKIIRVKFIHSAFCVPEFGQKIASFFRKSILAEITEDVNINFCIIEKIIFLCYNSQRNFSERGTQIWHINANGKGRLNSTDPPGICSVKIIFTPTAEGIFAGAIAPIRKTESSTRRFIPL